MALKSNGTTVVSKEKMAELVENARMTKTDISEQASQVAQIYNSLKNNEDLEGEEAEKMLINVENISKNLGTIAQKFAKVEEQTSKRLQFAEGVTKSVNKGMERVQDKSASTNQKIKEAGN